MSQPRVAVITFLDGGPVDPGYGQLPGYGGGYPSHGLPGGPNYPSHQPLPPGAATLPVFPFDPTIPDNSLPGSGGRPDNSLPPSQGRPDNTLPGQGGRPDNSLPGGGYPSGQPIRPGARFMVKWLACMGLILVPDNSLPSGSGRPDNELPETGEPK
jgi:hypothetical protein